MWQPFNNYVTNSQIKWMFLYALCFIFKILSTVKLLWSVFTILYGILQQLFNEEERVLPKIERDKLIARIEKLKVKAVSHVKNVQKMVGLKQVSVWTNACHIHCYVQCSLIYCSLCCSHTLWSTLLLIRVFMELLAKYADNILFSFRN